MIFYYKAKKNKNGLKYFTINADNKEQALNILKQKKIKPIGQIGEYLNEAKLFYILKELFGKSNIIVGKRFYYGKNKKYYEPDFIVTINNIETVIEFDGIFHYTRIEDCIKDIKKDIFYKRNNFKIIRIPYFIQFSKNDNMINQLFGKSYPFNDKYKNGFIDEKAPLPTDFCGLGLKRFLKELNSDVFAPARGEIIKSIKKKMEINKLKFPELEKEDLYLSVLHKNDELLQLLTN